MKIGFCGTMSVGKTTLVNTLKGQLVFASERAAELMQEKIITDRTIIDVMAFCALSKSMSKIEKENINNTLWHLIQEYDIIFHIDDLSVPIEDNGVRETNKEYRLAIASKIQEIITEYRHQCQIVNISGTTEDRVNQIKSVLDNMY